MKYEISTYPVGSTHETKRSGTVEVIENNDPYKVKVKFLNTGNIDVVFKTALSKGDVRDKSLDNPYLEGTLHETKHHGTVRVLEYVNSLKVHVEFVKTGFKLWTRKERLKSGEIRDKCHPVIEGRGFLGDGPYKQYVGGKNLPEYSAWMNMFKRCYKEDSKDYEAYKDCEVHPDWFNFQNFAKWYTENIPDSTYQLDKDLLAPELRLYSKDTCCFLPASLNGYLNVLSRVEPGDILGVKKSGDKWLAGKNKDGFKTFPNLRDAMGHYWELTEKDLADKLTAAVHVPEDVKDKIRIRFKTFKEKQYAEHL
ncbi:hypothetical protein [Vibrio phage vB_VmeM-Yong XC32]|nr:hypothetical protein [Vibrio phage vB_VmeM-Yong XC31]QAX96349.1 hypothetical protein [Vibrio phage vB_VmeM-Yong XC32]QAX96667.1 hypothetical protein [Vibrio phage vB_VmeM-Yong MS31]QAX96985.1 hypothetical protein [Vibrio phage vB_VmeM-Yong MS32]